MENRKPKRSYLTFLLPLHFSLFGNHHSTPCLIGIPSSVHFGNFHTMENLTYNNWTMDGGYSEDAGVYPYPHRALLAGAKNSLTINLVAMKSNIDHTCKESIQGFRVSSVKNFHWPHNWRQIFILNNLPKIYFVGIAAYPDENTKSRSTIL